MATPTARTQLAHRVEQLEARVAALEGRSTQAAAPVPVTAHEGPEIFWALRELQQRMPTPGGVLLTGSLDLPAGIAAQWQEGATLDDLLSADWDTAGDALSALGHPVRLRLVREVLRGRATTAQLAEVEGLGTTGQLHHHLRQLVSAGWLRLRARGSYEVPAQRVVPLLVTVLGSMR